jgi:hypothetical protein
MEVENEANKRGRAFSHPDTDTTPGWIRDYVDEDFNITFDPLDFAAGNPNFNPLVDAWTGFSFVHPPHAEAQLYCEKAAREATRGNFSVLLLPAVFNSVYWRECVYKTATDIRVFTCPVKMPGQKKQIVSQMCLVVFAGRAPEDVDVPYPPVFPVEPSNWQQHYYKRKRNLARFAVRK